MRKTGMILAAVALLGSLFVLAAPSATAGEEEPFWAHCAEVLDLDKDTGILLDEIEGFDWETCCIDYDAIEVPVWAEQYRCEAVACQAELGTELLAYLTDTYGDLLDLEQCCLTLDDEVIPEGDLKHRCPEPDPMPTPTETPTVTPTPEPTSTAEPVPPEVIVVEPTLVSTTQVPAFTG